MPKTEFVLLGRVILSATLLVASSVSVQAQTATVRDSSGIAIVEYPRLREASTPSLRLEQPPVLQIGSETGGPEVQFSRIGGITQLSDGAIAIADRGSGEVRLFDRSGSFVRRLGRRGQGPGEFVSLAHVRSVGKDSVVAVDGVGGRLTVFDAAGNVTRTFSATVQATGATPSQRPQAMTVLPGSFADGAFMAFQRASPPSGEKPSVIRDTMVVRLFSAMGAPLNEIGRFPGAEMVRIRQMISSSPSGGATLSVRSTSVLFGRETFFAIGRDVMYVGDGTTYEISGYDRSGRLLRIIRAAEPSQAVTQAMVAQSYAAAAEAVGRPVTPVATGPNSPPVASVLPAYGGLRVDAANRLWVKNYPLPRDSASRWTIFDAQGKRLGILAIPANFDPMHIGVDSVAGVWRDDLGVESVRVYKFTVPRALTPSRGR
jgi:hypothetical protein